MSLNNFTVYTSDIINTKWLSIRPFSCHFSKYELPDFKQKYCSNGYDLLGKFVIGLRSGEYIPKEFYSISETQFIYLNVGNFSKGDIDFLFPVYLENDIGEKYESIKVDPGDIIITRSGTVGNIAIFEIPNKLDDKIFIPSHHLAIVKTSTPDEMLFLKNYLAYAFCKNFFNAFSTGKVQKEITNWSIRRIPITKLLNKTKLEENFKVIGTNIKKEQLKNIFLQDSIDQIFLKYVLKSKSLSSYRTQNIITDLSYIGRNKALRIGAEYNDFWLTHNGHLFEGTSKNSVITPFKRIIKLSAKTTLKKGILVEPRILIDFEQIDALYGTINTDNIVSEIGSDKVEFGNCDFVTNKLDPYSGYTFIINSELNMIGTTELWPMEVIDKTKTHVEYIRYLLLSTEYLEKSKLLMSGKRHPRIHHLDLLNIKVPLPEYKIQEQIVREIQDKEVQSEKARLKIKALRKQINDLISEGLSKIENNKGNIKIAST